jgi:ribosomal protein S18 acetylase RimI-like enzyme
VGWIAADESFFERTFVWTLWVEEGSRRVGIATALLDAVANTSEGPRTFVSTNASNAPMHALLARSGWSRAGEIDGLDPGDPEVVYFRDRQD